MNKNDHIIRQLGDILAAAHGYIGNGEDALRFYLMHRGTMPARKVLAMRPDELLNAYDSMDTAESAAVH